MHDQDASDGPLVLLVDDDPQVLRATARLLERRGFQVATTAHPFEVAGLVRELHPSAVVLDVNMPALGGEALSGFLHKHIGEGLPIVFFSGIDEAELRRLSGGREGVTYACKGQSPTVLLERLRDLCG